VMINTATMVSPKSKKLADTRNTLTTHAYSKVGASVGRLSETV